MKHTGLIKQKFEVGMAHNNFANIQ